MHADGLVPHRGAQPPGLAAERLSVGNGRVAVHGATLIQTPVEAGKNRFSRQAATGLRSGCNDFDGGAV
jgi:hypothetical protein